MFENQEFEFLKFFVLLNFDILIKISGGKLLISGTIFIAVLEIDNDLAFNYLVL